MLIFHLWVVDNIPTLTAQTPPVEDVFVVIQVQGHSISDTFCPSSWSVGWHSEYLQVTKKQRCLCCKKKSFVSLQCIDKRVCPKTSPANRCNCQSYFMLGKVRMYSSQFTEHAWLVDRELWGTRTLEHIWMHGNAPPGICTRTTERNCAVARWCMSCSFPCSLASASDPSSRGLWNNPACSRDEWYWKNVSWTYFNDFDDEGRGGISAISGAWQNTASPSSACSPRRWVHGVGTVDPCVARCAAKPKIRSLQLDWLSQSPVPPLPTHLHAPAHLIFRWGANSSTPFRWNCHVVEVTVQVSFQWFWPSHCLTAVFYRFWSQQPSGTRLDIMPCIRCVWGLREYCLRSLVMKDVNNSMMFNASIFMGAVLQQRWCTGNATWQRQHYLDALSSHSRFMMCY